MHFYLILINSRTTVTLTRGATALSNAKKYASIAKVRRIIESCRTIEQTYIAIRVISRLYMMYPCPGPVQRELGGALDTAQQNCFTSEDDFIQWVRTGPRWLRRVPTAVDVQA